MGLAHEKKSYLQEKANLFEIGSFDPTKRLQRNVSAEKRHPPSGEPEDLRPGAILLPLLSSAETSGASGPGPLRGNEKGFRRHGRGRV